MILGFHGMDPDLLQKWARESRLPNIQRLMARAAYPVTSMDPRSRLRRGASFATGVNPGKRIASGSTSSRRENVRLSMIRQDWVLSDAGGSKPGSR